MVSTWLVTLGDLDFRVSAETRDKAIREAVKRYLTQRESEYGASVLYLMASTRKLPEKYVLR